MGLHGPFDDRFYPEVAARLNEQYSEGVSNHGANVLGGHVLLPKVRDRELRLEEIRLTHYPQLPSRFTSYFDCECLEDAIRLSSDGLLDDKSSSPNAPIWEVEASASFRADMNHFRGRELGLLPQVIHAYWRQVPSDAPFWENLLEPPVRVVQRAR